VGVVTAWLRDVLCLRVERLVAGDGGSTRRCDARAPIHRAPSAAAQAAHVDAADTRRRDRRELDAEARARALRHCARGRLLRMTVGVVLVRRRHCARMSGALTLPHSPRVSRRRSAAARDASPRWLKKDSIRPIRSLVAAAVVRSARARKSVAWRPTEFFFLSFFRRTDRRVWSGCWLVGASSGVSINFRRR
jgi:hypothetical protein